MAIVTLHQKDMLMQAERTLLCVQEKMQDKYDDATERWQESEKGEEYSNLLDLLNSSIDSLQELTGEIC